MDVQNTPPQSGRHMCMTTIIFAKRSVVDVWQGSECASYKTCCYDGQCRLNFCWLFFLTLFFQIFSFDSPPPPPACFVMFSRGSKRKIGKKRVYSFHRSMFLYLYSEVFRGYGNEILALNGLLFFSCVDWIQVWDNFRK